MPLASPQAAVRVGAVLCGFAALLTGGPMADAAAKADSDARREAQDIARRSGGGLSEASLVRAFADLDPGLLALARRHDPLFRRAEAPPLYAVGGEGLRSSLRRLSTDAYAGPAEPFILAKGSPDYARAVTCLTQAIYYEAALEPEDGQAAVAQVVLNRVRHPLFPKSVCGVVFQGAGLSTGCQFSFTCDGSMALAPAGWAWRQARAVAERALGGSVAGAVGTATHYHADYVAPYWAPTVARITQIGAHVFYRWPGDLGRPAAFRGRYAGSERALGGFSLAVLTRKLAPAAETAPPAEVEVLAGGRVHAVLPPAARPLTPRERYLALGAAGKLRAALEPEAAPAATPEPAPAVAATPAETAPAG